MQAILFYFRVSLNDKKMKHLRDMYYGINLSKSRPKQAWIILFSFIFALKKEYDLKVVVSFKSWNAVQLGVDAEVRVNFQSLDMLVSTCNLYFLRLFLRIFFYGYYVMEVVMTIVKLKKMFKNVPCFEMRHCMLKIYFVSFKGWIRTLGSENTDIV